MKYKICTFYKGNIKAKSTVIASSHAQAADIARTQKAPWTHVVVIGKTVKRYTRDGRFIKGLPKMFRTTKNFAHCILLMFGGVAEMHSYSDLESREKTWEKICTALESAASAKANPQPTDTTVSSVETSGSRNTLTSKKISNGYVMTAIWKDLETLSSIEKDFGKPSAAGMGKGTWSDGYEASPSKQTEKAFIVTVQVEGHDKGEYPSINEQMQRLNGKCIKVTRSHYKDSLWYGNRFYWLKKWLNFRKAKAIVKPVPAGTNLGGVSFTEAMIRTIGDVVNIRLCTDHHAADNGWCYEGDWLEPYNGEDNPSLPPETEQWYPSPKVEWKKNPYVDEPSIDTLKKELEGLEAVKAKFEMYSKILKDSAYKDAMKKSKTIYTTDGS